MLTKKQLICGNIYKTHFEQQGDYIFIATETLNNCTYVNNFSRVYNNMCGYFSSDNGFKAYTEASLEEEIQLRRCIKEGKYIPLNQINFKPKYFIYN